MYRSIRLFSQRGSAFVRQPAVRNFSADANAARGQQNAKHPEFDFKQLEKEITRLIQEVRDSLADDQDDKKKAATINQQPDTANFAGSVMDFWEKLEIKASTFASSSMTKAERSNKKRCHCTACHHSKCSRPMVVVPTMLPN